MGKIILNGTDYQGGGVSDVEVNGSSVVNAQGVAEVTVPDELADLADDSTHRTVTDTEKSTWSAKVSDNPTFTEASTRANIASGESFATILGKIKKWFSDLASMFVSKSGDTMSGNLIIQKAGETYCKAINSNTNVGVYLDSDSNGEHGIWSSGYYDSSYHTSGKWLVERKTDGSVILNGTADKASQDSDGNAINSTYLKKTGGDMTGMLGLYNENNVAINFRSNSDYYTTISYQTAGNEACVFATKKDVTSWIFVNGEDSVNNHANNRWASLTPALQIKNNCIAIGKLIANGITPTYKLEVAGDVYIGSGGLTIENNIQMYAPMWGKSIFLRCPTTVSADRQISLPNKDGTIALTSDISSRRYKENIIPLSDDEAKKILDVEIVNYDYKENVVDEDERYDQKGAIAEDVVNLIPNAVTYADIDGEQLPDGINYTKFIPYLIKMVQMQQKEIDELKAMIKEVSK